MTYREMVAWFIGVLLLAVDFYLAVELWSRVRVRFSSVTARELATPKARGGALHGPPRHRPASPRALPG